jgi:hypothetical protein
MNGQKNPQSAQKIIVHTGKFFAVISCESMQPMYEWFEQSNERLALDQHFF